MPRSDKSSSTATAPASPSSSNYNYNYAPPRSPSVVVVDNNDDVNNNSGQRAAAAFAAALDGVERDLKDARAGMQAHVDKYHDRSLDTMMMMSMSAEDSIAWDYGYDQHQARVDALIAQRDSLRRADDKARVVEILGYDEHRDGVLQLRYLEDQLRRAYSSYCSYCSADVIIIIEALLVEENYVPDARTGELRAVHIQHFIRFATEELADAFKRELPRGGIKMYSRMDADVQAVHTIRLVAPEYDIVARDKLNEAGELVRDLASIDDELARIGAVRDPVTGVPKLSRKLLDRSYYAQPETLRAWKRARTVGEKLKVEAFEVLFQQRPADTPALIARLHEIYQQESDIRLQLRSIQALDRLDFVF